jgi:FOG: Ankyrin repeat
VRSFDLMPPVCTPQVWDLVGVLWPSQNYTFKNFLIFCYIWCISAAVKLLLDMGSDINAQIETNRNTALTLACFQGRHEVVSLLLDRKANVEHRAKTGLTPLMEAASGGYVEVGRVLLDKGADVNAPPVPSSRDTALTIAADKGHCRFVELLLFR